MISDGVDEYLQVGCKQESQRTNPSIYADTSVCELVFVLQLFNVITNTAVFHPRDHHAHAMLETRIIDPEER